MTKRVHLVLGKELSFVLKDILVKFPSPPLVNLNSTFSTLLAKVSYSHLLYDSWGMVTVMGCHNGTDCRTNSIKM